MKNTRQIWISDRIIGYFLHLSNKYDKRIKREKKFREVHRWGHNHMTFCSQAFFIVLNIKDFAEICFHADIKESISVDHCQKKKQIKIHCEVLFC